MEMGCTKKAIINFLYHRFPWLSKKGWETNVATCFLMEGPGFDQFDPQPEQRIHKLQNLQR